MVRIALNTVNINSQLNMQNDLIPARRYTGIDRLLIRLEEQLARSKPGKTRVLRANPADLVAETPLTTGEKALSAGLMRVNHAGEVAAQALYQGQGLTARNLSVAELMQRSAAEEGDHLQWCDERLRQLDSHTSHLNPLWYLGSLSIGVCAGLAGDRWNLGFVAETERQVERHLDSHLARLPAGDLKSRAILEQMREDECHHAGVAIESGAAELPPAVKKIMRFCSGIMTRTAYWI